MGKASCVFFIIFALSLTSSEMTSGQRVVKISSKRTCNKEKNNWRSLVVKCTQKGVVLMNISESSVVTFSRSIVLVCVHSAQKSLWSPSLSVHPSACLSVHQSASQSLTHSHYTQRHTAMPHESTLINYVKKRIRNSMKLIWRKIIICPIVQRNVINLLTWPCPTSNFLHLWILVNYMKGWFPIK